MLDLVRSQYDVLHTLDLDEGASFIVDEYYRELGKPTLPCD